MTSEAERDLDQYILVDDNFDDGQLSSHKVQKLAKIEEEEMEPATPPLRKNSNSTANFNESSDADKGFDEYAEAATAAPQAAKCAMQR